MGVQAVRPLSVHTAHPPNPACAPSPHTNTQVLTAVEDYGVVSSSLVTQGLEVVAEQSGLVYMPLTLQEVADDNVFEANEALLERLLGVDDVDSVYTTCDGLQ